MQYFCFGLIILFLVLNLCAFSAFVFIYVVKKVQVGKDQEKAQSEREPKWEKTE